MPPIGSGGVPSSQPDLLSKSPVGFQTASTWLKALLRCVDDWEMADEAHIPQAVLIVQEHLAELTQCYSEVRPHEAQREAVLHAFAAVLGPVEMTVVNQFIAGQSDPILGEGAGAKFVTDMEAFFERRSQANGSADGWSLQYQVEVERRTGLDLISCAEAWATDETAAALCGDAIARGDEETWHNIVYGAARMIVAVASKGRSRAGKRIKLDDAMRVVRIISDKNPTNSTVGGWCGLLTACLRQAKAEL